VAGYEAPGDSYLQKGDKKRSQFAFGEASKLNFDKKIKEETLFNYAKLTFETAYSPFGEAIAAFCVCELIAINN
jgi:hypothetical protein